MRLFLYFDFQADFERLPNLTYPDIVNNLIFTPSPYTAEDLKAYKSLEAYNQFTNGWVSNVLVKEFNSTILVKAKVKCAHIICGQYLYFSIPISKVF